MTKPHLSATTLKFLLAARQSQLHGLEALATTSVLVGHVSRLVHALQKERGYSTLFLAGEQEDMPAELAQLRRESQEIEADAWQFLQDFKPAALRGADRTRLLHCISYALYRLDGAPDLRWQVRERKLPAQEAGNRFTRVIACLLSLVFEAADCALDPAVTRILVALFNFMQGKELSGQERAQGVMGYRAGHCRQDLKERLRDLVDGQRRSFDIFVQHADEQTLLMWQDIQLASDPMRQLREILLKTSPSETLNTELAGLWYDACTARIDAMRGIEQHLTKALVLQCQKRIAQAQQELSNHQLLLSRFVDDAGDGEFDTIFDIPHRPFEASLRDGLGYLDSQRMACSRPATVTGYMRPCMMSCIKAIDWRYCQ